jgi:predicted nucleic acid-binding protein
MKTHVLDANALYRFLRNGNGADQVEILFKTALSAGSQVLMSVINWGEVHYTLTRQIGISKTDSTLQALNRLPLVIVRADIHQTRAAAILKSSFGLPYADCFAAALTARTTGVLVTADVKDFARVPWLETMGLPAHKP